MEARGRKEVGGGGGAAEQEKEEEKKEAVEEEEKENMKSGDVQYYRTIKTSKLTLENFSIMKKRRFLQNIVVMPKSDFLKSPGITK